MLHQEDILDQLQHQEGILGRTSMEDLTDSLHPVNMEVLRHQIKDMAVPHHQIKDMEEPVLQIKDTVVLRLQTKEDMEVLRLQTKDTVELRHLIMEDTEELRHQIKEDTVELLLPISMEELMPRYSNGSMQLIRTEVDK